jgi:hypothetical protein
MADVLPFKNPSQRSAAPDHVAARNKARPLIAAWLKKIDVAIREGRLSALDGRLARALTDFPSANQGKSWPSQLRFAATLGKSARTIRYAVARLERVGFLLTEQQGWNRSCCYTFILDGKALIWSPPSGGEARNERQEIAACERQEIATYDRQEIAACDRQKIATYPFESESYESEPLEDEPPPPPPLPAEPTGESVRGCPKEARKPAEGVSVRNDARRSGRAGLDPSPQAIADEIAALCGVDPMKASWLRSNPAHVVQMRLADGYTCTHLIEGVRWAMATKRDGPPHSINYFREIWKRVRSEMERPVPQPQQRQWQCRSSERVVAPEAAAEQAIANGAPVLRAYSDQWWAVKRRRMAKGRSVFVMEKWAEGGRGWPDDDSLG